MALPKKIKKTLPLTQPRTLYPRRQELKEMIELKLNSIKLYKQYIPGSLMKIIEEK